VSRSGCSERDGLRGTVALVTGANRGLGRALVDALLRRGVGKVYAASRKGEAWADRRVAALCLDVTDPAQVAAAAQAAGDTVLLINNAGVNRNRSLLAAPDFEAARAEMETNYFGTLAMCRTFAPVLRRNGGGCIVHVLSVAAHVGLPAMGSLCASKAAALRLTECVRAELAGQRTFVASFLPSALDTDMTRGLELQKEAPEDAASALLDGLAEGLEDIWFGDAARRMRDRLRPSPDASAAARAEHVRSSCRPRGSGHAVTTC
jgi:NAD(P)-dependent dehydrogenase (short-subunit alcohol dehydrogenase family)